MKIRSDQKGFSGVPLLVGLLALVLVGAGGLFVYNKNQDSKQVANISTDTRVETKDLLPADLTGLQPIATIQDKVTLGEGVTILGIELESEGGKLFYKVKLSDNTFLWFDATTGDATTKPNDDADDDQDEASVPKDFSATITLVDARKTAQVLYPDKTIKKIKLESEEGVIVYSVRFTDGTRVDVSATDGSVTRNRVKTDNSGSNKSGSNSGSSNDSSDDNDDSSDDNSASPASSVETVTLAQAQQLAFDAHAGDDTLKKTETETEDGQKVYSFRFTDEKRVDVNAVTGEVITK